MKKKHLFIFLIYLISLFGMSTNIFAYDYPQSDVNVNVVSNENIKVFVENEDGSEYKTLSVLKNNQIKFSFEEPGEYKYTVRQIMDKKQDDIKYDETVWNILIAELDEDGTLAPHIVIWDEKTGEKSESVNFQNIHIIPKSTTESPPESETESQSETETTKEAEKTTEIETTVPPSDTNNSPETGDDYSFLIWFGIALISIPIIIVIIRKIKNQK